MSQTHHEQHLKPLDDIQYLEYLQAKDLRFTAIHEAGHKVMHNLLGGFCEAVMWKNPNGGRYEKYWLGQCRLNAAPLVMHEPRVRSGCTLGFEPPANWEVLVGLAGIVAEEILEGENDDPEIIADNIDSRIPMGDVSDTDLELMNITNRENYKLSTETIEQVWRSLRENWSWVEQQAQYLIEEVLTTS